MSRFREESSIFTANDNWKVCLPEASTTVVGIPSTKGTGEKRRMVSLILPEQIDLVQSLTWPETVHPLELLLIPQWLSELSEGEDEWDGSPQL